MSRPISPSSIAVIRILFAIIMIYETVISRFWKDLHYEFNSESERYPLMHLAIFDAYPFPTSDSFRVLKFGMYTSLVLVACGLFYRVAIVVYTCIYWYFFFLDIDNWTNHVR